MGFVIFPMRSKEIVAYAYSAQPEADCDGDRAGFVWKSKALSSAELRYCDYRPCKKLPIGLCRLMVLDDVSFSSDSLLLAVNWGTKSPLVV
jgi:hypothetical protein